MNNTGDYLAAAALAFVAAQLLKSVLYYHKNKRKYNLRVLYASGNMPSGHTASVTALATAVGAREGVESSLFAIVVVFGFIIAYDALHVRRASGEQGVAIQEIVKLGKYKLQKEPYHALGHKPHEVLVGALIGFAAAWLVLAI